MPVTTPDRPDRDTPGQVADDAIRRARAFLMRVVEPPAPALAAFVAAHGPVATVERVRADDVPDNVRAETSGRLHPGLDAVVDDDLAAAERLGARLVVPEDDEWPTGHLTPLSTTVGPGQQWAVPPLALWARGPVRLVDIFDRPVSIVGARAATGYGDHIAAELAYTLADAEMTVVSGAAYGIDGAAHRGALSADGITVAILGCGIDIAYPAGHSDLLARIAASGLLVSEYPLATPSARHRFLVRNRLIALSTATVVVEAGERSGARNVATSAAALGKTVLAVPGPITSAMSNGCHDLIRAGTATLVTSIADIHHTITSIADAIDTVGTTAHPS